jgi:hypothetical protein
VRRGRPVELVRESRLRRHRTQGSQNEPPEPDSACACVDAPSSDPHPLPLRRPHPLWRRRRNPRCWLVLVVLLLRQASLVSARWGPYPERQERSRTFFSFATILVVEALAGAVVELASAEADDEEEEACCMEENSPR